MKIDTIDSGHEILVIAEIGNNHEGSYGAAEEMIGQAARAGAQAVKFQTFQTERFVTRADPARFERLQQFELTQDEFARLAAVAKAEGVSFISTPLDLASADFLTGHVAAFKIASGDNSFYPLIERVAASAKPLVLSTGIADLDHIDLAVQRVDDTWRRIDHDGDLALLHCVASYPVPPAEANLAAIGALKARFPTRTVGYSDHTLGVDAAILSVALGAEIIEKHFTLDKNFSDFRDHQMSADPAELAELVARAQTARLYLGSGNKQMMECERAVAPLIRRSIVAGRDLAAGTLLSDDDIGWTRPGGGLAPGTEAAVLGRRLNQPLTQGDMIQLEMLG